MPWTPLDVSPLLRKVILGVFGFTLLFCAAVATPSGPQDAASNDFKVIRRYARIIHDGRAAEAYDLSRRAGIERDYPSNDLVIPYTYPPLYSALIQGLARIPDWLGYLLFMGPALTAHLLILRRLAGPHWPALLAASTTGILITMDLGQNGLWIAAITGGSVLLALGGRRYAGAAVAGLMAIKPHLALSLPLAELSQGRWRALAVTAAIGLGLTGLGFACFDLETAQAFRLAVAQASDNLALGNAGPYRLERMVSVYAALRVLDVPYAIAMLAHALVAAAAAVTAAVLARGASPARSYGLWILAGLFVSPYLYDYDLNVAAVALALLACDGVFAHRRRGWIVALACHALAPVPGLCSNQGVFGGLQISLGAPILIALFAVCARSAMAERRAVSGTRAALARAA